MVDSDIVNTEFSLNIGFEYFSSGSCSTRTDTEAVRVLCVTIGTESILMEGGGVASLNNDFSDVVGLSVGIVNTEFSLNIGFEYFSSGSCSARSDTEAVRFLCVNIGAESILMEGGGVASLNNDFSDVVGLSVAIGIDF